MRKRGLSPTNAASSTGCFRKRGARRALRGGTERVPKQRESAHRDLRWGGSTVSTGLARLIPPRMLRRPASRVWTGRRSTANRPSLTHSGFRCTTWTWQKRCARLGTATGPTVAIAQVPWNSGLRRSCTQRRSAARRWNELPSSAQRFGRDRRHLPHPPSPQGVSGKITTFQPPGVLLYASLVCGSVALRSSLPRAAPAIPAAPRKTRARSFTMANGMSS